MKKPIIDLRPDHLAIVLGILRAEIPDTEVGCFGSRARWTSQETSDLDLVLRAPTPLPLAISGRLKTLFEESYLPFDVDLVDWHRMDPEFREAIRDEIVPLMKPRKESSSHQIPNPWQATPLSECAEFLSGGTPSKGQPELWQGDIPWVRARDLRQPLLENTTEHVSPEAIGKGAQLAPAGTVLILVRGLHDDLPIALIQRDMTFHQDIKALIPRKGVDPRFLAYALRGNRPALRTLITSVPGMGQISTALLKSFPIALPPLEEQQRIAALLGALDDKITLNHAMNQTLEEMAQTLCDTRLADFQGHHERQLKNQEQSRTLAQILDTLLPKLISGELRIPAAKNTVSSELEPGEQGDQDN